MQDAKKQLSKSHTLIIFDAANCSLISWQTVFNVVSLIFSSMGKNIVEFSKQAKIIVTRAVAVVDYLSIIRSYISA
jgi:hypothetical protein